MNLIVESDRNEKNRKKIVSQSAQGVVGEKTDPAAQKENRASKINENASMLRIKMVGPPIQLRA